MVAVVQILQLSFIISIISINACKMLYEAVWERMVTDSRDVIVGNKC